MSYKELSAINSRVLAEATERGTANDFWLVLDCRDSVDYKEYVHRTNAQGLINTITKLYKNIKTRKCLDTIAIFNKDDKSKAEREAKRRAKLMKNELEEKASKEAETVTEDAGSPHSNCTCGEYKREELVKSREEKEQGNLEASEKHVKNSTMGQCASCEEIEKKKNNEPSPKAKTLKDTESKINKVTEDTSCQSCLAHNKSHTRLEKLNRTKAQSLSKQRHELAKPTANLADYHAKEAKKPCAKCVKESKTVNEHYYADHSTNNVLKTVNKVAGNFNGDIKPSPKYDTVYGMKDKESRIYQPSEQDALDNEDEVKLKIPPALKKQLKESAADARKTAEELISTKTDDKVFYTDLANAFDDLRGMLEKGTVSGLKEAQTFMTTLMGPMLYRIPSDVAIFIAQGGESRSLRSYVNSITVPKIGYNVNGELDKL